MRNKTLAYVALVIGVLLLTGGLLFLCAATRAPSRTWLSAALLALGVALVAWAGVTLRRLLDLNPERVADRVLELVRRRGDDEITEADIVGSLGVPMDVAQQAVGVLAGRQLIERQRRGDRDVLVFPQLRASKVVRRCPYCGSSFSVKTPAHKCPNCGAPLEISKG